MKKKTDWERVMEKYNPPAQWALKTEKEKNNERLKFEIAQELGLIEQIDRSGWKSLTARETGRIGGLMNQKKKKRNEE